MTTLAVAALSARMLTEAARDDGYDTVALDAFGDADTRHAASQWQPIGAPDALRIDATRLLAALAALARRGDAIGWIAGSGFDGRSDLLARAGDVLPLIGTQADAVRRVRDPAAFFAHLDREGIPHPAVQLPPPADGAGWLVKDAGGCGGWQIRRVPRTGDAAPFPPPVEPTQRYYQREMAGVPMSATYLANGREVRLLGFNRLFAWRFGARPFVFSGAVGPVSVPDAPALRIAAALRSLAPAYSLRGLGSLDFILDGDAVGVLEVNPRPPASMVLYRGRVDPSAPNGLVAAHLRACLSGELQGELPGGLPGVSTGALPRAAPASAADAAVRGFETVFALRPVCVDAAAAASLARMGCHDVPSAATRFGRGDPVCSVSASGPAAEPVRDALASARRRVQQILEIRR